MSTIEFNQLLLTNAEFLRPFAVTLTHDSEIAKDLFQETLFRALSNKEKYNVGTNIKAWLYTIMRNIFINDYREKPGKILFWIIVQTSSYWIIIKQRRAILRKLLYN
jgi:RNA polymerase sigma factor (sigma-70 family)